MYFTLEGAFVKGIGGPTRLSPKGDGLVQQWAFTCWMNPPYSEPEHPCKKNCKKKRCVTRKHHSGEYVAGQVDFIKKAYESAKLGTTTVCLIPARTDTAIWHKYIFTFASEIRFIEGRLKFDNEDNDGNPAPFPSAVVVFNYDGFVRKAPKLSTMKA